MTLSMFDPLTERDLILAEREETRAERDAEARARHQRVMQMHYRWAMADLTLRRNDRVRSGPWCPAGTDREVRMSVDFSHWVEQHHASPTRVLAALFEDRADDILARYADARARADADALGEP